MVGLSLLASACYNNPEVSSRAPGSGSHMIHSKPQVGPGTTAGGSTAGPQPVASKGHSNVQPQPGATHSEPGNANAAKPGKSAPEHEH